LREERRAQQAVEDALGKTAAPKPSKHKLKKAAKERDRHKRQTRKRAAANQKFSAFDDSGSGSGKAGSGKANGDAAASSREPIGFGDLLPPPRNRAQHGQAGPRNAPAPPSRHQLTAANLAALNGNMDGGAPRNNRSISDSSGSYDSFHTAHSHHSRGRSGSASSISSGDRFHTPRGRSPSVSSDGGSIGSHHSPPAGRPNIRGSSDPKP
jgi:hypothetical protein